MYNAAFGFQSISRLSLKVMSQGQLIWILTYSAQSIVTEQGDG